MTATVAGIASLGMFDHRTIQHRLLRLHRVQFIQCEQRTIAVRVSLMLQLHRLPGTFRSWIVLGSSKMSFGMPKALKVGLPATSCCTPLTSVPIINDWKKGTAGMIAMGALAVAGLQG